MNADRKNEIKKQLKDVAIYTGAFVGAIVVAKAATSGTRKDIKKLQGEVKRLDTEMGYAHEAFVHTREAFWNVKDNLDTINHTLDGINLVVDRLVVGGK